MKDHEIIELYWARNESAITATTEKYGNYCHTIAYNAVWGFDSEVETRVTDETLRRIRKKLLQAGSTVSVSTIWGFGYKLKEAERT